MHASSRVFVRCRSSGPAKVCRPLCLLGIWLEISPNDRCNKERLQNAVATINSTFYVFGGVLDFANTFGSFRNDLLAISLGSNRENDDWIEVCPNGDDGNCGRAPAPRGTQITSIGSELFVFGGGTFRRVFNDLWSIRPGGGNWMEICSDGGLECGEPSPPRRGGHAMAAIGEKLYIFGGESFVSGRSGVHNDLWMMAPSDGGNWTRLCSDGGSECGAAPSRRSRHTMVALGSALYIFGGFFGGFLFHGGRLDNTQNDLWTIEPGKGNWTQLCSNNGIECGDLAPARRSGHVMAGMFLFESLFIVSALSSSGVVGVVILHSHR